MDLLLSRNRTVALGAENEAKSGVIGAFRLVTWLEFGSNGQARSGGNVSAGT
jgi:hypothetical protein